MKTRILAFFLTLCMILSMVPAVAFAEEAPAPSMDAIKFNSSFEKDATIKLDQDLTVALTTAVTGKVTIDLNGKTLRGTIVGTKDLTIEVVDSSYPAEGATLGTFNVAVTDATVLMTEGKVGAAVGAYDVNTESEDNAKVVTYTGKIWSIGTVYYATLAKALKVAAKGAIITYCTPKVAVDVTAVPTVEGGLTIDLNDATANLVEIGNVTIANAVYTAMNVVGDVTLVGCSSTGVAAVTISDGKKLTVKDGTHADWLTDAYDTNKVVLPANAVVIGNTVVVPEAGNTGSIVAVIGAKGYDSLSKAIAAWMGMAAKDRTSIDLIADIEGYVEVTGTALVKLNLNGHDVNATFINNGELIVTGTGKISAITNKGKLTLDGENSVITSLTNFDANSVFEMKAGTLDSFGANSDLTEVVVYGGWVANSIYNQDYVDAGSVGYPVDNDDATPATSTHVYVKAAPAVIKNGTTSVKGYTSFAFAWADVLAGKFDFDPTITLNDNATYIGADIGEADNKLYVETTLTIDVNGYTLTLGEDAKRGNILVDETTAEGDKAIGNLTLTTSKAGGKVVATGTTVITYNNAVVTLDGGVELSCTGDWAPLYMYGGTAYVYNAVITNTSVWEAVGVVGGNLIIGKEGGKDTDVIITATKFTAISVDSNATGAKAEVTVNCGTITGGTGYYALYLDGPSAGTINGGNFKADSHTVWVGYDNDDDKTELNISGGTFASITGKNIHVPTEAGTVTISGGTFNNVTTKEAYVEISGYFAEDYATAGDWTFTDEGMTVTKTEYVIAVDGVKYSSWAAAWAAAGSGKPTFVVIETTPSVIGVMGDLVLDLNGQTLDGLTLDIAKDNDGKYVGNYGVEVYSSKPGAKITGTINVPYGRVKVNANTRLTIAVEDAPVINVGEDAISISQIYGNNNGTTTVYADAEVYPVAGEGAAKVQIVGGGWNIDPTYKNVPYGNKVVKNTSDGADPYWTIATETTVAEILVLGGTTSVERFASVAEAVDYYLAKYDTSVNTTHYIKVKAGGEAKNYVIDVTTFENIKYGASIPFAFEEGVAHALANDEKYVALPGASINLWGTLTLQCFYFMPTVASTTKDAITIYYSSVEDAIAANAGIVTVLADEQTFSVKADATIDLNGFTADKVTVVGATASIYGGTINTLIVEEDGMFDGSSSSKKAITIGKVVDNGGVIAFRYTTLLNYATEEKVDAWLATANYVWTVSGENVEIVHKNGIAAMIGNVAYTTVQGALDVVEDGDTVVLYKDAINTDKLPTKPMTITVTTMDGATCDLYTGILWDAQNRVWDVTTKTEDGVTTYTVDNRVAVIGSTKYYDDSFASAVKAGDIIVLFDISNIDSADLVFTGVTLNLQNATNVGGAAKTITVNAGCTITSMINSNIAPNVQLLFGATSGITVNANPEDVAWDFAAGVNADKTQVYFYEETPGSWVLKNAQVTGYDEKGNGKGYENLYAALCDANVVEIKLLADITTDFVVALNDITIDLAGYTWTLANVSGGIPAAPAITVTNSVTIKNGKIALDDSNDNDNYVLIAVVDGGDLTVEGLTIPKAFGYNMTEGYSASVAVNGSFYAVDSTIAGDILALGKEITTLSRENTTWGKILGEFTCGDHQDPVNGECSVCGEEAAEIVYDKDEFNVIVDGKWAESANGVYVYVGTEVSFEFIGSLEYNEILNGITLNGAPKALSDTFTADAATTYTLKAKVATKPVVDVTINANQFTLYDAAGDIKADFFNPTTLQLMVGVEYTITFNGSENVYWVNGDNSIVGTAPEFTFVPTEAVEVKAITYGGGKYVIVLNGPAVAGTTVSYNNPVNAFVSMPALPTTIAGKTVSGWLVNGEAVEGDVVEYIKKAADALYVLTPVYSYAEAIVVVINGKDTTVTPGKVWMVTADATIVVDEVTKYFTGWVVKDGEKVVYETKSLQLVYSFAKAGLVAEAQYSADEADMAVETPTVTIGVNGTSVFGHYYNPNGTITSLGIIYSTTNTVEDDVLQGNVKNKDNIDDNEKTAMWNFKVAESVTVYVQAYMTYVDSVTGQLVTVYSTVENFTA